MDKVLSCSEIWGGGSAIDTGFTVPGMDGALFSRPADGKSGGDIYLVSNCNMGQVSKLVLADVAGHGESVARVGQVLSDLLRSNIAERDNDAFLSQLNAQFSQHESLIGTVFATLACSTFYTRTRQFFFAYAGHPQIILGRAGRWQPLELAGPGDRLDGLPIGVEESATFRQGCIRLDAGDWLLVYSDGLVEARNDLGQEYGLARILRDLDRLAPQSPMALKNGLLTRLTDFAAPRPLDQDDITLIALRLIEPPPPPIVTMDPELARLMGQGSNTDESNDPRLV